MDLSELKEKYAQLEAAPIIINVPVLWGDMDSANHVNNLVYLRWTEDSRIKLFEKFMDTSFQGNDGPILGWHDCKYIFPMTYPDIAVVTSRVSEIRNDRFLIESKIYSHKHSRIAALSYQSIIPYSYRSLKKIEIPISWEEKLKMLM